eukprot:tig00020629_g12441.t1
MAAKSHAKASALGGSRASRQATAAELQRVFEAMSKSGSTRTYTLATYQQQPRAPPLQRPQQQQQPPQQVASRAQAVWQGAKGCVSEAADLRGLAGAAAGGCAKGLLFKGDCVGGAVEGVVAKTVGSCVVGGVKAYNEARSPQPAPAPQKQQQQQYPQHAYQPQPQQFQGLQGLPITRQECWALPTSQPGYCRGYENDRYDD